MLPRGCSWRAPPSRETKRERIESGKFFGPYIFGLVRDATGNSTMGLIAIAIGPVVSAILVLLLGHDGRLEQIPIRQVATP
jgi:hypothetical protein